MGKFAKITLSAMLISAVCGTALPAFAWPFQDTWNAGRVLWGFWTGRGVFVLPPGVICEVEPENDACGGWV